MFMTAVISVSCNVLMVGDVIHRLVDFELYARNGQARHRHSTT
jgi:hypothetical protein